MAVVFTDMRRHLRYSVNEPCRAKLKDCECDGAVVNMSVAGAAVHLDLELDVETEPGTIIELEIKRVGLIRTRAVRTLIGGVAVQFLFNPEDDRALIAKVWRVLNEFAPDSKPA